MTDTPAMRVVRALMGLWVFALVLALSPQTPDPALPIKWLLTSGTTVVIVLISAGTRLFSKAERPNAERLAPFLVRQPLAWAIGAFIGVYVVLSLLAPWPWLSLLSVAPWCSFALFAFIVPRACTQMRHVEQLLIAAVAAIASSSVYGFAQHFGVDPFPWSITNRFEYTGLPATYGHPNFAGHALVLGIIFCVGLLWPLKGGAIRWSRSVALCVALGVMLWHLAQTGMRAGTIALAAAAVVVLAAALLRRLRVRDHLLPVILLGGAAAFALGGALCLLLLLPGAAGQRLGIDSSWVLRLNGYHGAARMFLDKWFLGFGPGQYREACVPYWTPFEQRWFALYNMRNDHVHNEILEAAAETGIWGVAALLGLFLAAAWSGLKLISTCHFDQREESGYPRFLDIGVRRFGYTMLAGVVAFVVDAQFGFNLHTPAAGGLFFMLLGLSLAAARSAEAPGSQAQMRYWPRFIAEATIAVVIGGALPVAAIANYWVEKNYLFAQGALMWAQTEAPDDGTASKAREIARTTMHEVTRHPFATAQHWDLLAQMEGDSAVKAFARAVEHAPENPAILARAAETLLPPMRRQSLFQMTRVSHGEQEAIKDYAYRAEKLCPELASPHYSIARLWLKAVERARAEGAPVEQFAKLALMQAQQAVDLSGTPRSDYWWALARAHAAMGDGTAAQKALAQAVAVAPWDDELWEALQQTGDINEEAMGILHSRYAEARETLPRPPWLAHLALGVSALQPEDKSFVLDALPFAPTRMALWGALADTGHGHKALGPLLSARQELGECDAASEAGLETLYGLLDALVGGDAAAAASVLQKLSAAMPQVAATGADAWAEWGWVPALARDASASWATPSLTLRIAALFDATGDASSAAELAAGVAAQLSGVEQGLALHYQSRAQRNHGNVEAALALAQQAAARAPFALEVRWNLARCLADAGRLVEADFEYMSQLQKLNPEAPEARQMRAEYELFQARVKVSQ